MTATVTYITHNLINTKVGVVAHGCNCQGVMGSGVAADIKGKWPIVYERYHSFVSNFRGLKRDMLGLAYIVNVGESAFPEINQLFVSNMFTQERYGRDGAAYASAPAIASSLKATMGFCEAADLPLYMPRVGCGLGGLNWEKDVQPILAEMLIAYPITVYVCDK